MSKVNLRRLAKRIHQGLSKDMTLMQIQHLIAQAHGHDNWDSVLSLEKDKRARIYVEVAEDGKTNHCYLDIDGYEAKINIIEYNGSPQTCWIQIGPPSIPFKVRRLIEERFPYIDVYREPPELITKEFDTLDDLAAYADPLKTDGYQLIPSDDPMSGRIGIAAFKESSPDVEHKPPEYLLQYYPFGKMELVSEKISVGQLVKLFDEDGFFNCDNPEERTLGVIKYENGKAYRYFCRLMEIKDSASKLTNDESIRIRSRKGRGRTPMKEERMELMRLLAIEINPLHDPMI